MNRASASYLQEKITLCRVSRKSPCIGTDKFFKLASLLCTKYTEKQLLGKKKTTQTNKRTQMSSAAPPMKFRARLYSECHVQQAVSRGAGGLSFAAVQASISIFQRATYKIHFAKRLACFYTHSNSPKTALLGELSNRWLWTANCLLCLPLHFRINSAHEHGEGNGGGQREGCIVENK